MRLHRSRVGSDLMTWVPRGGRLGPRGSVLRRSGTAPASNRTSHAAEHEGPRQTEPGQTRLHLLLWSGRGQMTAPTRVSKGPDSGHISWGWQEAWMEGCRQGPGGNEGCRGFWPPSIPHRGMPGKDSCWPGKTGYPFPRAAVTKPHSLGDLDLDWSPSPRGWQPRGGARQGWVLSGLGGLSSTGAGGSAGSGHRVRV